VKRVGFEAEIIELKVKKLASEDKSMRLILQVDAPGDELVDDLNRLFRCEGSRVGVAIAEKTEG